MQFRAWLKVNMISATQIADAWGISDALLSQCMNGHRWPTRKIMVRAYIISNGLVGLSDWAELYRDGLVKEGVIKPGELVYVESPPVLRKKGKRRDAPAGDEDIITTPEQFASEWAQLNPEPS